MSKVKKFLFGRINKPQLFVFVNKLLFCKILEHHTPIVKNNGIVCSFCNKGVSV